MISDRYAAADGAEHRVWLERGMTGVQTKQLEAHRQGRKPVVALIALILILAILGGLGFAVHLLWIVLVVALVLWLVGFFVGGVADATGGGRRRWYGR
jgi:uncharacterized membrane protein YecN with MAPEG domain